MTVKKPVQSSCVSRPALRYYGGGWTRAPWTVGHFPRHDAYLEPCFGAGSVLFRKRPAKLETVNDKDGRVVNFFRALRERPGELIDAIRLTPWAEGEYRRALHTAENDDLEDARRFFLTCWASIKGGPVPGPSDFRFQKKLTRRSAAVRDVVNLGHLHEAARRSSISNQYYNNQQPYYFRALWHFALAAFYSGRPLMSPQKALDKQAPATRNFPPEEPG